MVSYYLAMGYSLATWIIKCVLSIEVREGGSLFDLFIGFLMTSLAFQSKIGSSTNFIVAFLYFFVQTKASFLDYHS